MTPEIARADQIPIEPIIGISPFLVANFNRTASDSDNTHNHDASQNAIPFRVRTPDQAVRGDHQHLNDSVFSGTSHTVVDSSDVW